MKMKHIIALCLVFALVLPSTALAASQPALSIKSTKYSGTAPLTVTLTYTLSGANELTHRWYLGDGFSCPCHQRTYTYKNPGLYTVTMKLKTVTGQTLIKTLKINVRPR